MIMDVSGWVFWPTSNRGYWNSYALRIIADELDRRDRVLFVDLPIETPGSDLSDFLDRVHE
jgi:hypothetical protein